LRDADIHVPAMSGLIRSKITSPDVQRRPYGVISVLAD
jgi:hypothetical protein